MPLSTLLLQLLPVLLLAWLGLLPAAGLVAFALQALSVGSILLALALVALWTMPPFWTPYVYGIAFLAILLVHMLIRRPDFSALWSAGIAQSLTLALVTALAVPAVYASAVALMGRAQPAVATVNIAPPFGSGVYLVAHGGSTLIVNIHLKTLDTDTPRYAPWRGQSHALDIFRIKPSGLHVDGWRPSDPARYVTFGTPVLAPCAGRVALVVDGLPDMRVPRMDADNKAGNFVAIRCDDAYVILAHLRRGSVAVEQGATVSIGDPIAEMGNTGNSSEPHLHVHAQRGLPDDAPFGGEPLGLTIRDRYLVRNDLMRINGP